MSANSEKAIFEIDDSCSGCHRCFTYCKSSGAIKGSTGTKHSINESKCVNCGQCLLQCPQGSVIYNHMIAEIKAALIDPSKEIVAVVDPAVSIAIGEEFGLEPGVNSLGKICAALRIIGFNLVFDGSFGADMLIMAESANIASALKKKLGINGFETASELPVLSSSCPAWLKFAAKRYPKILPYLSQVKSPPQIMGTLVKSFLAKQSAKDMASIYVVSISPCTAARYECERQSHTINENREVDAVLTTRDLAYLIKEAGIDFSKLAEESCDEILGQGSGAGMIFGACGGQTEGLLRSIYEHLSENTLENKEFLPARGSGAGRSISIDIPVKSNGGKLLKFQAGIIT